MNLKEILADIKSDRKKTVIIDTDTYNEMDDQYAIAYAIGSEKMNIAAINAAPFHNHRSESFADGMEKSYDEIMRVLEVTGASGKYPVYKGSSVRLSDSPDHTPIDSPAARNIIKEATASKDILYILTIGAITNVASAILMEPAIKEKICIVWLGGNCIGFDTLGEFNLVQDYAAGQIVLNSGVPLILLPAIGRDGGGTMQLKTRLNGLQAIKGDSRACKFFREELPEEFVKYAHPSGWERIIWDIAAPGVISIPEAFTLSIITAPIFGDNQKYYYDSTRHEIIYMNKLDADAVFADTYECISKL